MAQLDTEKIISTIANSKKTTPVKVYLKGKLADLHFPKSVHAFIGKHIGAEIGAGTMIDMGAVLGGRAIVGKHCHIGAGTVLAGVVEPPSAKPVTIGDHVMTGANAVVLEGVTVGEGAVIAAGAVVINDVPAHTVVAGVPAKVIKKVNDQTEAKTVLLDELRKL